MFKSTYTKILNIFSQRSSHFNSWFTITFILTGTCPPTGSKSYLTHHISPFTQSLEKSGLTLDYHYIQRSITEFWGAFS